MKNLKTKKDVEKVAWDSIFNYLTNKKEENESKDGQIKAKVSINALNQMSKADKTKLDERKMTLEERKFKHRING